MTILPEWFDNKQTVNVRKFFIVINFYDDVLNMINEQDLFWCDVIQISCFYATCIL